MINYLTHNNFLSFVFFFFFLLFCNAQSFNNLWYQTINPSSSGDYVQAITADASGIYVAGYDNSPGNDEWRIEKRDLTTGALISAFGTGGVVISNPSSNSDRAFAITADTSGIYVAGWDWMGHYEWRIEKRDLTTGALISAFGTGGVVLSDPGITYNGAWAITADTSGIYVAGWAQILGDAEWRIEKRDLTTGSLISAFGTGGVVKNNPSSSSDYIYAITADASGIYVAGNDGIPGNFEWRIEKRDLTTGALISAFGAGGVITSNPSSYIDIAYAIITDASGIYVAGKDAISGYEWRIEKRDLTTGALISAFGTGGVVISNPSPILNDIAFAITADASGLYVAGYDCEGGTDDYEWRIEKRDLTTGALLCTQNSNPVSGQSDEAYAITTDASGIYVAGYAASSIYSTDDFDWRIEKYDLCSEVFTSIPSATPVSCLGSADGSASIFPSGGVSPYSFFWSTGDTTQTITGLSAGNYFVTVTDFIDSSIISTVIITEPPLLFTTLNASVCNGDSILINNTWHTTVGIYYDSLTSMNNCDSVIETILSVNPSVNSFIDTSICSNDSIFLGGGWQTVAGTYIDTLTSYSGCDSVISSALSVSNTPFALIIGNNFLCKGDSVELIASGGDSYLWSTGATNDTIIVNPLSDTIFIAAAINSCGNDSDSVFVTVKLPPSLFIGNDTTIRQGTTIQIVASGANSYSWSTGETSSEIKVSPSETITYYVTATDAYGCVSTDSVKITVDLRCEFYFPTIFTPNGDGNNDKIFVSGSGLKSINLFVYDRWGELVFEEHSEATLQGAEGAGWNGTYKNKSKEMNTAVFAYILEITCYDGTEKKEKGNITLVK